MAFRYTLDREPYPFDRSMFLQGFDAVLRTGGCVPAFRADPGRDDALIQEDEQDEWKREHLFDAQSNGFVRMVVIIGQSPAPVYAKLSPLSV
jgi:hypothetical protein